MKPCKNCPFRLDAPLGIWHPVEYLLVAYLGSVRGFADVADLDYKMGCHEFNRITRKNTGQSPRCGGWLRAARDSFPLTLQSRMGRIPATECAEMNDGIPVLTPEEVAQANGLDLDKLPPRDWLPGDTRYPTVDDWAVAVRKLRAELRVDPEHAWTYVIPGSPLDSRTSDETIRECFGEEALQRYKRTELV